jgi:GntR family transcriptional repressor for pyruvate dehydrogenase complex
MDKEKGNITNKIISYIHGNIENGNWPVGHKIESEPQIAQTLNVSRASVRVAIRQFIALGILESVRGKGTFVISTDAPSGFIADSAGEQDCTRMDVIEFRFILEPKVCELAAQRITESEIQELRNSIDKMMATDDKDLSAFLEWDNMFHLILARASKNPLIERAMINLVKSRFEQTMNDRIKFGKYVGYYYHKKILEAIENRNSKLAGQLMVEHIDVLRKGLPAKPTQEPD